MQGIGSLCFVPRPFAIKMMHDARLVYLVTPSMQRTSVLDKRMKPTMLIIIDTYRPAVVSNPPLPPVPSLDISKYQLAAN